MSWLGAGSFTTQYQLGIIWKILKRVSSVSTRFQPGKYMADAYSKQLQCLQQQMIVLLTSLQLSAKLLTLCIHRQNTLKNINKCFGFQRKSIKKQLFSRQQRKTRKKRQYWFRNCSTDKWWVDMMLAVAPVEDLRKKNFRLSRAEFDEICNELRPYISPNILSQNHRALAIEKKFATLLHFLKDTGSMTMTANTFRIHQCTLTKL